jgi:hypothetical protein
MIFQNASAPVTVRTADRGRDVERFGWRLKFSNSTRSPRRQYLARHLHRCGPRPVLEALLAVAAGADLDATLADFGRLPTELYQALGADILPIDEITIIEGERS